MCYVWENEEDEKWKGDKNGGRKKNQQEFPRRRHKRLHECLWKTRPTRLLSLVILCKYNWKYEIVLLRLYGDGKTFWREATAPSPQPQNISLLADTRRVRLWVDDFLEGCHTRGWDLTAVRTFIVNFYRFVAYVLSKSPTKAGKRADINRHAVMTRQRGRGEGKKFILVLSRARRKLEGMQRS